MTQAIVVVESEPTPKRHKKRLKLVRVPTTVAALDYYMRGFRGDVQTILGSGLTVVCLSNSLGVSETTVHRWRSGIHRPRELIIVIVIMLWAEELRHKIDSGGT